MTAYKNVALNEKFLELRGCTSQLELNVETTKWLIQKVGLERSLDLFFQNMTLIFLVRIVTREKRVINFCLENSMVVSDNAIYAGRLSHQFKKLGRRSAKAGKNIATMVNRHPARTLEIATKLVVEL